jgi:8-oxo-dGTP pyrophosphatase MutT (NUDIX family)
MKIRLTGGSEPSCALVTQCRVVHSADMGAGDTQTNARLRSRVSPAEVSTLSQLEQVAAVCYRLCEGEIEFLLVRTRRGRWTFPKGGSELDLTGSQAAAAEALEEAGAQGRIEETSFTSYRRGKRPAVKESAAAHTIVNAYLFEVERLQQAQELNRNPTWFSPVDAKMQMREDRHPENGAELARVIDCAVRRIRRIRNITRRASDLLPKVTFEKIRERLL